LLPKPSMRRRFYC